MADKKKRLLARARDVIRGRNPNRLREEKKKTFQVLGLSLYAAEIELLDSYVNKLKNERYPMPSRSLVVREAIRTLRELVEGKTDQELSQYFFDRQRDAGRGRRGSAL